MDGQILDNRIFDIADDLEQYQYSGKIFTKRYLKQFFVMLITNLSTLVLITVDGIVVGRFVGEDALNSVNLLNPFVLICGALTLLVARGVNVALSKAYGIGHEEKKKKLFRAIVLLTGGFTVAISLLQIPIAYLMINFYPVTQNVKDLMQLYAIGIIIANSISVVSTVCTYILIASGQVGTLLKLAIFESLLNLILDLVFVAIFKMGVLGAGLGTAISCTARCILSVALVQKTVKIFNKDKIKCKDEVKDILSKGFPSMINQLAISATGYIMSFMIARTGNLEAITVISVSTIGVSIISQMANSFVQAGNSIMGLLVGSEDWEIAKNLEGKMLTLSTASAAVLVSLIVIFPQMMFMIYGISEYTDFQLISLRLYVLNLIPFSMIANLSSICVYCGKEKVVSSTKVLEVFLLIPVFALLECLNHNLIFLCYAICGVVSVVILFVTFEKNIKKKISENRTGQGIHFSFRGNEANDVSEKLFSYLKNSGASEKDTYNLSLVCEELGSYAEKDGNAGELHIFLAVKIFEKYIHVFYLDDSEPAILNKKLTTTNLILGNYNLLESKATEFTYQNVSGYNNFIMSFER